MSDYAATETQQPASTTDHPLPDGADESVAALVKKWCKKVKNADEHWKKTFDRMRECQKLARQGHGKDWTDDKYVVPVLVRHINQSVGQLYAKNPTWVVKRRPRLLYTVWDEKMSTAQAAIQTFQTDPANAAMVAPLLQDIIQGQNYMRMTDKVARTLEIAWDYYLSEQKAGYKQQLKALVRRTKTNCIGYVILGFQRQTAMTPDIEASINDAREKLAHTQQILEAVNNGEVDPDDSRIAELQSNLDDLQNQGNTILREGPVIAFPRSTDIVIDPEVRHLKTLSGANWWAQKIGNLTPDKIKEMYQVDVSEYYTKYTEKDQKDENGEQRNTALVWKIQDGVNQQEFVICEGYYDFLVKPAAPSVQIDRFFTLFPLIFNEVEDEENPFPDSDVWHARHAQDEYNRARQGLREHRYANRPAWFTPKGTFDDADKQKLSSHAQNEVLELNAIAGPDTDVRKLIQPKPVTTIDPAQYDVESCMQDVLRSVGSQEANLGPTSGATATETSIAENSRMSSRDDNVDDLDDFLSEIGHAGCQLMLLNLSKETITEIVGPGAAWPELPQTKDEIAKDLLMQVEAGSSGRPNQAAEIANLERAMPWLTQLPGVSPEPLVKKAAGLLGIDVTELFVEGLPSIVAVNQMMNQPPADPNANPASQGPQGANNAPVPAANEPGSQPAMPTPVPGNSPATGA